MGKALLGWIHMSTLWPETHGFIRSFCFFVSNWKTIVSHTYYIGLWVSKSMKCSEVCNCKLSRLSRNSAKNLLNDLELDELWFLTAISTHRLPGKTHTKMSAGAWSLDIWIQPYFRWVISIGLKSNGLLSAHWHTSSEHSLEIILLLCGAE